MKSIAGYIATHDSLEKKKVVWDKDSIVAVEEAEGKADYLFSDDCVIFPGFCDKHTHPREFPLPKVITGRDFDLLMKHKKKEDFKSLSEAAIVGGVTRLGCILNTPRPAVNQEIYGQYLQISRKSLIPVVLYGMIGKDTKPFRNDIPYKFMWSSVGADTIDSDIEVPPILQSYKIVGIKEPISVSKHCESIDELALLKDRPTHEQRRGFPVQDIAIQMALEMQQWFGYELQIMHVSTASCVQLIAKTKKARPKAPIHAEACPHHLFLDESARHDPRLKYGNNFFMNPCLQKLHDREMLITEIGKTIEYVSSDHAGHTLEDKEKGAAGITGVHVMGPAAAELHIKHKVPLETIAKVFAYNPGQFLGKYLNEKIGDIKPGYKANFTVLNLKKPIKMSDEFYTPKCGWNPWAGYEFAGSVEATFVNGEKLL